MITILSGLPGNGKTLYAVQMLQRRTGEGKPALYKNINGLSPLVASEWPHDLADWAKLPPGSLLVVDEAQDFAATQGKQGSPKWVTDLSKHRHIGADFVFITQDPRFLDPWIRRLCNRHVHLVRKMGLEASVVHEWDKCQDDPRDYHALEASRSSIWRFPKELYPLYKSAEVHTVKRSIPRKVYIFLLLFPVCGFFFWYGLHRFFSGDVAAKAPAITAKGSVPVDPTGLFAGGGEGVAGHMTGAQYVKLFEPVVRAWPWSAPAFQSMKPVDYPVPYCMEIERGKGFDCKCLTQQGTRYNVEKSICKQIAEDGVFDPFHSNRHDADRGGSERSRDRPGDRREWSTAVSAPGSSAVVGGADWGPVELPRGGPVFAAGPTANASGPIVSPASQNVSGSARP